MGREALEPEPGVWRRPNAALRGKLIEDRLRALASTGKINLQDVMAALRVPDITGETAGYGQVVQLRRDVSTELVTLWIALASPLTAPFLPFPLGVTHVPAEFQGHRDLTESEAARLMDRNGQGTESTRYAFQECKRLFYLVDEPRQEFLPEVT